MRCKIMSDSIKLDALAYLYKELKKFKISLANAEKHPNVPEEQIKNIEKKIAAVDYLIGLAQKE